ncbi:MAG TPA: amidohydrolase family protein, partial [Usitatibacter sp.]
HGDRFAWAASIHPYRKDAIAALDKAVAGGARAIKWIPYLMGIDPSSSQCDAFYARLAHARLPLIIHSGWEHALVPGADQEWGNPLRMRRPLEAGVTVVAAHCATQGDMRDDESAGAPQVPAFQLLRRLIDEPGYRGRLYGDISGVISAGRDSAMVRELVLDERWRGRLVNGSDYPLPGATFLTPASRLAELGFIDAGDLGPLTGLQARNPLLFDLAVKRLLRFDGKPFDASIFQARGLFPGGARQSGSL